MDTPDYNYSSLSEIESLSDSDWLDIASSRGDEDSVADFDDSDREDPDGRPVSRRSFSSIASSRDEVVEGWEGLIEDAADDTPLADITEGAGMLFVPVELTADRDASSALVQEEDPDDERVKAALDQSMISTLSSSRPSSLANSVQTSIVHSTRSLRLSFPDPTTSRLRSLSTSFEDLAPSDADVSSSDAAAPDVPPAESAADPNIRLTPEILEDKAPGNDTLPTSPDTLKASLNVVLYGSSPVAKVTFVEMLLHKWALSCNATLEPRGSLGASNMTREYESASYTGRFSKRIISVVDKTGVDQSHAPPEFDGPSLAIVFLPSFSDISIAEHTLYLPVIMSSPHSQVDVLGHTDYLLEAEQQWDALAVPPSKLTSFSQHRMPVIEQEILDEATSQQVGQALRQLFPTPRQVVPKVSAHTLTIFAILSMVLGYIVHGSMNAAPVVNPVANRTIATPLWGLLRPSLAVANKCTPTPLVNMDTNNLSVNPTSFKSVDVAVFSSVPLTSSTVQEQQQPVASSSTSTLSLSTVAKPTPTSHTPLECECGCGLLTWPGKTETTDVILRPTGSALTAKMDTVTSISLIPAHTMHAHSDGHKGKGKERMTDTGSSAPPSSSNEPSLYALSSRIVTSLTEYLDFTPLGKLIQQDMQELFDALDALVAAITRQSSVLRERHERAKQRARQMREAGGRWIEGLKERIRTQTEAARANAKALKAHVVGHLEASHRRGKQRSKSLAQRRKQRWAQRRAARSVTV